MQKINITNCNTLSKKQIKTLNKEEDTKMRIERPLVEKVETVKNKVVVNPKVTFYLSIFFFIFGLDYFYEKNYWLGFAKLILNIGILGILSVGIVGYFDPNISSVLGFNLSTVPALSIMFSLEIIVLILDAGNIIKNKEKLLPKGHKEVQYQEVKKTIE